MFKPPISLNALTDKEVEEITSLLIFDSSQNSSRKTNEWLQKQESKVKRLKNEGLLRPDSLLHKGVMKLFHRQTLCQAHKELDSSVIRSLLWNIAYESTAQTNIYRVLRIKGKLWFNIERCCWMTEEQLKLIDEEEDMINDNLEEWLDLTNEITALWLGQKKYRELCGSKKRDFLPGCAKTGCDACMLAAVGGNCHYLTSLRASLLARHLYKTDKQTDNKKRNIDPPSLLRVVDAWISKVKDSRNTPLINDYSKELARSLVGMRILARRLEDEHIERRKKKGKKPKTRWGAAMVTWTDDKLPVPIKHKQREKPPREDAVIIDWTTELTRGFRAAIAPRDNDESGSARMSGAIRTEEAASEVRSHPPRDSRSNRGTRTHINFNDSNGDVPAHFSGRASPLFNVGLEESTSSWTSRVVEDDYDDDDIYDEDMHEECVDSREASSIYSRDERHNHHGSPEGSIVHSGDERDEEGDYGDSKALTKWEGGDGAA
ncbi:hypothetical protein TGAM01_v201221 [Trichoderma gamsii]|uniref:Uncharacterized protein n=1 Tax=Trichoderma gamsii TaxID=398673 RepID=A0A2P4ZZY2_9HYPO|nr:hypothetical protein TGAM01_v201221 [Trichoderma gamsii]PON29855.1 hypothetical protein TGAM01_v201221 [Trichoderma gamsii]